MARAIPAVIVLAALSLSCGICAAASQITSEQDE